MADLGADVIKIEPRVGRRRGTSDRSWTTKLNPGGNLYFWHYNTSKRGVTLDLNTQAAKIYSQSYGHCGAHLGKFSTGHLPSLGWV
ncbi:MAG: hypothetical protein CM1200mP27_12990 [Chloroflexota bacterium]|nr:MAG: hypothetical protein CM1200mP27_12990 [Chloroflexota bacterium]